MAHKSPLEKVQDAVTEIVGGVRADPAAAAGKAAEQVRGILALGFMAVGQVAQLVAERLMQPPTPPPSAPGPVVDTSDRPTPADVARVVELKPSAQKAAAKKAPAKKAPAKKAPAKKTTTPSAKLPPTKASTETTPPETEA